MDDIHRAAMARAHFVNTALSGIRVMYRHFSILLLAAVRLSDYNHPTLVCGGRF